VPPDGDAQGSGILMRIEPIQCLMQFLSCGWIEAEVERCADTFRDLFNLLYLDHFFLLTWELVLCAEKRKPCC